MKHSTVLATAIAIGLAFTARAKTYTPVFTEDFESASSFASGWTWDGSAHEQAERTLIDGTTKSQFLHITGTTYERGDYAFTNDCTALTDYRLEFDWFANMGFGGKTCRLICYAGESELFHVADPNPGNETTSYLYINGADTTDTANAVATFTSAGRGANCTGASNQKYWYHITITANETDGVFLKIASQDSSVGTVYNARISDFSNVTKMAFTADSKNYNTYGGIDNIVFSQGASESFVWTGAEEDNKWATPGNWTVDGEATTKYPEIGDAVSGLDATALAAMDIAVKLETTGDVTRFVNFCAKNVKVWTGAGTDTNWSTLENWGYTAGFAAYEIPAEGSTVVFPSTFTDGVVVTLTNDLCDTNKPGEGYTFNLETDTTIQSASSTTYYLNPRTVSGNGKLTLGNVQVRTKVSDGACAFNVELCIKDSVTLYLRGGGAKVTFSGALSGTGTLKLDADTNGKHSFTLTGDMSGFAGTLEIPQVIRDNAAGCSYSFNGDDSTIDLSGVTVSIADPMTMTLGGTYDNNILKIGALTGAGTISNNTANAMTLQVGNDETDAESSAVLSVADGTGAWTVAKTGANTQSLTDATVACNVSVSGGTLKLPVGKALGTVAVSGGTLGFAADAAWEIGTAYDLFTYATWASPAESALTLDQSALAKICVPSYDFETAGTVKVTLSEAVFVWNGGTSGRWDDSANWMIDGETASAAPKGGEKVTIDGATVLIDTDTDISGVTLSNGAKLALGFTDDNLNYTIPEGFSASDFVVAGPYTMAESEGVLTATRTASTFVWNGGASGEWTDSANWRVGGGYTAVVPGTGDTAVFGTSAEVLVSASAYAGETRLDADVTFSGEAKLQCPLWRGDGKLSLAGITLTAPTEGHFIISNNVEVVAKTTNTLTLETAASSSESDYRYIYLEGNMTGAGYLALDQRSRQGLAGGKFSGDNREFSGEIEVVNCKDNRDATQFIGAHSTSSNAVYTVYGKGDSGNTVSMFPTQNTTYYIGSIDGNVQQARSSAPGNVILEIGALNRNNSIGGHFGASNKTGIRKVGTGTLTCSAANIGDVEIAGGTYEVTKDTQSGNITFTGNGIFRSTIAKSGSGDDDIDYAKQLDGSENYPIVFDDGGFERTWATAIKASNKAGFTKMGSGTLTLGKPPLYTGLTTVKEGTLYVPDGSDITYNPLSAGTLTGVTPTKFAYPAGTTLTGAESSKTFDGTLDVSNVTAIDVSDATLTEGTPFVVAAATTVTGFTKDTIVLTLPAGTDTAKWTVKIMSIDAKRSLCVAPPTNPFVVIVR